MSLALSTLVGVATFIFTLYSVAVATTGDDIYHAFPIWLWEGFYGSWVMYALPVAGVFGVVSFLSRSANSIQDSASDHIPLSSMTLPLLFLIPATIAGGWYVVAEFTRCSFDFHTLIYCVGEERGLLYGLFGSAMLLMYFGGWLFGIPILAAFLAGSIPMLITGFVVATTSHSASGAITRTASTNRPTNAADELKRVMRNDLVDYEEAERLLNSMNPLTHLYYSAKYRKRIHEAKRLSELLSKRNEAMDRDAQLARDTLATERRKRGR